MSPIITPCILLVQTEEAFNQRAILDLKQAGYNPVIVADVKTARTEFEMLQPAMVVLDRKRSGEAGVKFCRHLRKSGSPVLILMLIDQETVEERIACLEAGADDYLLKSHQLDAFKERVHFYLQPTSTVKEQLRFADIILDLSTRRLFIHDKEIDLTMKEFELLKYLMSNPREVVTREQILENVWGFDFRGESNVIEVYVRYLRLKIENEGQKRLIHTVRGVGYVLRET